MTFESTLTPKSTPGGGAEVVVLVGNPRARSRTRTVAEIAARRVAARLGLDGMPEVVDLSELGAQVLVDDAPAVVSALERVAAARLVVVATPVYKGSYTGLLKAFLDRYGHRPLEGVVAVPVVVSASRAHALAGDEHLLPLLVELGAQVPVRSFAVVEAQLDPLDQLDALVDGWLEGAGVPWPEPRVAGDTSAAAVVGAAR